MILQRGGPTLAHEFKRPQPNDPYNQWFGDVLQAVIALHGARMTHADIKAENIVLNENGSNDHSSSILLIDFGSCRKSFLSRSLEVTTIHTIDIALVLGTESINDGQGRDVFAVALLLIQCANKGVALYEMMKDVKAHPELLEFMKAWWTRSMLHERTIEEKEVIVDNLWRCLVFCHTRGGFYMKWIEKRCSELWDKLSRFQKDADFVEATELYSLQFGTETATIRESQLFVSETVAVWTLVTLLHPMPEERTSLQNLSHIINQNCENLYRNESQELSLAPTEEYLYCARNAGRRRRRKRLRQRGALRQWLVCLSRRKKR
jgi:serine/threonine protein kinase